MEKRMEANEEGLWVRVTGTLIPNVSTFGWPCPALSSSVSLPALPGSRGSVILGGGIETP